MDSDELERIWKEAVVIYSRHYPGCASVHETLEIRS
jgi:hypothetical protein